MSGRTVHCRKEPFDVYIGRGSPFGNPYAIGIDGTRDEVIDKFEAYARKVGFRGPGRPQNEFRRSVISLRGKVLGCWCGYGRRCHGDVLLTLAEEWFKEDIDLPVEDTVG